LVPGPHPWWKCAKDRTNEDYELEFDQAIDAVEGSFKTVTGGQNPCASRFPNRGGRRGGLRSPYVAGRSPPVPVRTQHEGRD